MKWGTVLFGIIVLMLYFGVFTRMGAFKWIESHETEDGDLHLVGIVPAVHYGDPFGFEIDEIKTGGLAGKVIIVTGANTGLGFSSVLKLVSKGAEVIMGCRSKARCNAAAEKAMTKMEGVKGKGKVVPMIIDLNSFESIKKFSDEFFGKYNKLDSLMLNAGIMLTPYQLTEQGIESQIGVNHFGHFYLTHLLLPVLRQTATPTNPTTICSVSSSAHYRTYNHGVGASLEQLNDEENYQFQMAYGQSKLANVLFSLELAEREKERESGVLVNVIHPGAVETELSRYFVDGLRKKLGVFSAIIEPILGILSQIAWDSDTASLTQVYASVGPKLLSEKITGKYFHPIARENPPNKQFAHNQQLRADLWALSEQVVRESPQVSTQLLVVSKLFV